MRKLFIPILMCSLVPVSAGVLDFIPNWGNNNTTQQKSNTQSQSWEVPTQVPSVYNPYRINFSPMEYQFSDGRRINTDEYRDYMARRDIALKQKDDEKKSFDNSYFGKIANTVGVSYNNAGTQPVYSSDGGIMGNVFSNMFNTGSNAATSAWNFGSSIYNVAADKVNSALKSVGVDSNVINKISDFVKNSPSVVRDIIKQQMTPDNIAAALISASGLVGIPGPIVALVAKYAVPVIMKELGI